MATSTEINKLEKNKIFRYQYRKKKYSYFALFILFMLQVDSNLKFNSQKFN